METTLTNFLLVAAFFSRFVTENVLANKRQLFM
jgi:hypothetical protein